MGGSKGQQIKVYLRNIAQISKRLPVSTEEEKALLSMQERRQSGTFQKQVLMCGKRSVNGLSQTIDGIIMGTGYGSMEITENLLNDIASGEVGMKPRLFMQSTPNSLAAQLAIALQCRGYNNTYSHDFLSFESVLMDALLQIESKRLQTILIGAAEEVTPLAERLARQAGYYKGEAHSSVMTCILTTEPSDACCVVEDLQIERGIDATNVGVRIVETDCDIASLYGESFVASAMAVCDAVNYLQSGKYQSLTIEQITPKGERSLIRLSRC